MRSRAQARFPSSSRCVFMLTLPREEDTARRAARLSEPGATYVGVLSTGTSLASVSCEARRIGGDGDVVCRRAARSAYDVVRHFCAGVFRHSRTLIRVQCTARRGGTVAACHRCAPGRLEWVILKPRAG